MDHGHRWTAARYLEATGGHMTTIESLTKEFEHEVRTTRKHLERLPEDKLDWRPHQKSFTARGLASHIVECVGWAHSVLGQPEVDINPATHKSFEADSTADLLSTFDGKVTDGRRLLAAATDGDLEQPWRLKIAGRVRFERPRSIVFRDFCLSHLIHHRGQLSVYLRLLDVPVPGSYGPTADEQF
jgi:uncharacterized damage-inducible protein DinB